MIEGSLRDYWFRRVDKHLGDSYAGHGMSKFPEDLRTYEHLLWDMRADAVIELGTAGGGSALWFRDRLRTLETYGRTTDPLVVTVDVRKPPHLGDGIVCLQADVRDPRLPDQVVALVGERRCLVVEDSAHEYDTTYAALAGFHRFVPAGGFMVVEDGCVDVEEMRQPGWPRGVLSALSDWLETPEGEGFRRRPDLEMYGITCHPNGFLERHK